MNQKEGIKKIRQARTKEEARKAYDEVEVPAWKAYNEFKALAWKAYVEVVRRLEKEAAG